MTTTRRWNSEMGKYMTFTTEEAVERDAEQCDADRASGRGCEGCSNCDGHGNCRQGRCELETCRTCNHALGCVDGYCGHEECPTCRAQADAMFGDERGPLDGDCTGESAAVVA